MWCCQGLFNMYDPLGASRRQKNTDTDYYEVYLNNKYFKEWHLTWISLALPMQFNTFYKGQLLGHFENPVVLHCMVGLGKYRDDLFFFLYCYSFILTTIYTVKKYLTLYFSTFSFPVKNIFASVVLELKLLFCFILNLCDKIPNQLVFPPI